MKKGRAHLNILILPKSFIYELRCLNYVVGNSLLNLPFSSPLFPFLTLKKTIPLFLEAHSTKPATPSPYRRCSEKCSDDLAR